MVTIPFEKILPDVGDKEKNLNPTHELILRSQGSERLPYRIIFPFCGRMDILSVSVQIKTDTGRFCNVQ